VRERRTAAIFVLLFASVLRFLPDAQTAWRDVWFGAVVTAVMFATGKHLIGLYLARKGLGTAYGAAGSLIVVLVWVYYSSLILLLGAEITQAWAQEHQRRVQPEAHAVRKASKR
jgi:membrane protein